MPYFNTHFWNNGIISNSAKKILLSSINSPKCRSNITVRSSVIVDSGASVCITPHKSDFISYQDSNMKIKDLSSSNLVSGEGILRWPFQGTNGKTISIKVVGYHIPTAKVKLLSPQVLLQTVGGHAFQTVQGIDFTLDNGFQMVAKFCPQSNLPLLSLAPPY